MEYDIEIERPENNSDYITLWVGQFDSENQFYDYIDSGKHEKTFQYHIIPGLEPSSKFFPKFEDIKTIINSIGNIKAYSDVILSQKNNLLDNTFNCVIIEFGLKYNTSNIAKCPDHDIKMFLLGTFKTEKKW